MSDIPKDIADAIKAQLLEGETFTAASDLRNDLRLDSLDGIEIVIEIEDARGISFDDGILASARTVGDLVAAIEAATADAVK